MAKNNQAMSDLLRYNSAMYPRKRSSFNKSHSHATTLDSAYLVPLMWDRVLPGDEKKIRYSGLARMATPYHPTMDEANLDVWCFYVPDRLWWNHAREFYGENKDAEFNPDGLYIMPNVSPADIFPLTGSTTQGIGSLADYFGLPFWTDKEALTSIDDNLPNICVGPFRSYQLIWNEWFRNSSVQPSVPLNDGDTVTPDELNRILKIRKVCKNPDYYTSLLPEPQAGPDVLLPLGEWAPVVTREQNAFSPDTVTNYPGLNLINRTAGMMPSGSYPLYYYDGSPMFGGVNDTGMYPTNIQPIPSNLWADLTSASAATVNNIRAAITVQQLLEVDNLAGKRYQQILQAHFGVLTPDGTLQRPELLGATRTPIGMRQVLQTSATSDGSTPLGNTAAFSLTNVTNEWICNKAFTEPGYIIVLGAIRPLHSYSQGLDELWTKLDRYDHYWPVFDNLGNQPVYRYNVNASESIKNTSAPFIKGVFGYKEAWTEYRVKQNRVSGLFRPDVPGSLASWNYSTHFGNLPSLTSAFVEEDPELIDRTIAVESEPQFLLDSYFDYIDIKNMSVHSIPGLTRL